MEFQVNGPRNGLNDPLVPLTPINRQLPSAF